MMCESRVETRTERLLSKRIVGIVETAGIIKTVCSCPPKVSKGRPESPLVVPAGTKHLSKAKAGGFRSLRGATKGLTDRPLETFGGRTSNSNNSNNVQQFQQCTTIPTMHNNSNNAQQFQQCTTIPTVHSNSNNVQQFQQCTTIPTVHSNSNNAQQLQQRTTIPTNQAFV
jgi:hypothetical protein